MTPDDLRAWRQRLGWSQAVAAERLGCGRRSLQQWEQRGAPKYIGLACSALDADLTEWSND